MQKSRRALKCAVTFVIGIAGLTACTINVNDSKANENGGQKNNAEAVSNPSPELATAQQQEKVRWTVAVCSSRSSEITLQAGPNEKDSRTFATWTENNGQRIYEFPAQLQSVSEIHFRAISSEAKPVELCILYDGRPKKRVAFDEGSENHTIEANDDDGDCRCTR